MAGQARIVLFAWVRTPSVTQHDRTSTWTEPRSRARSQGPSRPLGSGLVGWRVIGANNRELGRGAQPSWRVDEAYQSVQAAQMALDRTVTRFSTDPIAGWSWHISLDGEEIAFSSRAYRRQRECVYSVEQFRERFPTAKLVASLALRSRSTSRGPMTLPSLVAGGLVVTGPTCEVTA
jgi:hypothetical protein